MVTPLSFDNIASAQNFLYYKEKDTHADIYQDVYNLCAPNRCHYEIILGEIQVFKTKYFLCASDMKALYPIWVIAA